ncbi:hypothetical protein AOB60_22090 [Streptomyces noursei]|uniref:Uncharacterized protein n=1 Tax=Streptomyces noursei TaxID=1971 RepID=A0A2N8P7Y6_STRNR|nr:hypothetical protein AOB60_22090 [Streptomyces noursei]
MPAWYLGQLVGFDLEATSPDSLTGRGEDSAAQKPGADSFKAAGELVSSDLRSDSDIALVVVVGVGGASSKDDQS